MFETSSAVQQQQRINEFLSEMQGDLKVVEKLMQRQQTANKRLGRLSGRCRERSAVGFR